MIEENEIPDVTDFKFGAIGNGRTLANIYINRIYKNVQKVEVKPEGFSKYSSEDKKIILDENKIDNRIRFWDFLKLDDKQRQGLKKKLRAKIITHELIHAGSDCGNFTGFSCNADNLIIDKLRERYFSDSKQYSIEMTRLEELITEYLALDIVGFDEIPLVKCGANGFSYICKNVDSSNAPLNSIAEYFVRSLPDVIKGKFVDPLKYLVKITENHVDFNLKSKDNFILILNNYLRFMSQNANKVNDTSLEGVKDGYNLFQGSLLDIYNKTHSFDDDVGVIQAIKDFVVFENYAYKTYGKIDNNIQEKLDMLKNKCKYFCQQRTLDFNDIYTKASDEIMAKCESSKRIIKEPYSSLKEIEGMQFNT